MNTDMNMRRVESSSPAEHEHEVVTKAESSFETGPLFHHRNNMCYQQQCPLCLLDCDSASAVILIS